MICVFSEYNRCCGVRGAFVIVSIIWSSFSFLEKFVPLAPNITPKYLYELFIDMAGIFVLLTLSVERVLHTHSCDER